MNVNTDDTVEVMTGENRGDRGRVLRVLKSKKKVVVEGMNMVVKNVRRSQQNPSGGQLKKEMPLDWSNVRVVCPGCGEAVRVGIRYGEDGSKVRFCKKCDAVVSNISGPRKLYAKK